MYSVSVSLKYLIFTGASPTRGAATTIRSVVRTARASGGDVPQESQCAIHRFAVGERTRHVRFEQDEVRPRHRTPIIFAADDTLQLPQIVLRAKLVSSRFHLSLMLSPVVARGEAPVVNTLSRGSLDVGNINEYVDHGAAELLMEPSVLDAELLVE